MPADTGGEQKRTAMISGHALTDAINEDKQGEGDLSGRYGDIPGKTGCLFWNKNSGNLQESVRRHSNADKVQTTLFLGQNLKNW